VVVGTCVASWFFDENIVLEGRLPGKNKRGRPKENATELADTGGK